MLKTTQRLVNKNSLLWWYVFKTSWKCLQDVFATRFEDVLKTSWRRLEDEWTRRIYWSWSRRLEDVFKMSSEDEDERRLKDVFIKTNASWEGGLRVFRKQSPRGVFRNFAKFTGKHLCQSLFSNKVAGLKPKNTFFYITPLVTALCEQVPLISFTSTSLLTLHSFMKYILLTYRHMLEWSRCFEWYHQSKCLTQS